MHSPKPYKLDCTLNSMCIYNEYAIQISMVSEGERDRKRRSLKCSIYLSISLPLACVCVWSEESETYEKPALSKQIFHFFFFRLLNKV